MSIHIHWHSGSTFWWISFKELDHGHKVTGCGMSISPMIAITKEQIRILD